VRWSALPDRDVSGIWSGIAFARNDGDLERVAVPARALIDRIARWLSAITPTAKLEEIMKFKPGDADAIWTATETFLDTELLRDSIGSIEPADDATADALIASIERQGTWYAAFARLWHLRTVVAQQVNRPTTDEEKKRRFAQIDVAALDKEGLAKTKQGGAGYLEALRTLKEPEQTLRSLYQGKLEELEEQDALAIRVGQTAEQDARIQEASRQLTSPVSQARDATAPAAVPRDIRWLNRQDVVWSLVIVVVTCAAYMPAFYDDNWGRVGDYGTAFAAGFLGKVIINWALLPVFQSLSPWERSKSAIAEPAPEAAAAESATADVAKLPAHA
jgi:hypothetical protein